MMRTCYVRTNIGYVNNIMYNRLFHCANWHLRPMYLHSTTCHVINACVQNQYSYMYMHAWNVLTHIYTCIKVGPIAFIQRQTYLSSPIVSVLFTHQFIGILLLPESPSHFFQIWNWHCQTLPLWIIVKSIGLHSFIHSFTHSFIHSESVILFY